MMTLCSLPISGNGYGVRMLLSFHGIPDTTHPVDLGSGEKRGEALRAFDPIGQGPVKTDDGEVVNGQPRDIGLPGCNIRRPGVVAAGPRQTRPDCRVVVDLRQRD